MCEFRNLSLLIDAKVDPVDHIGEVAESDEDEKVRDYQWQRAR